MTQQSPDSVTVQSAPLTAPPAPGKSWPQASCHLLEVRMARWESPACCKAEPEQELQHRDTEYLLP